MSCRKSAVHSCRPETECSDDEKHLFLEIYLEMHFLDGSDSLHTSVSDYPHHLQGCGGGDDQAGGGGGRWMGSSVLTGRINSYVTPAASWLTWILLLRFVKNDVILWLLTFITTDSCDAAVEAHRWSNYLTEQS